MTKKEQIEKALREIGYYPKRSGSVTIHVSPENKVSKIEIRNIE